MSMLFRDREEAGKKLAASLLKYRDDPAAIVIALPRGGVVLGFEVAHILHLPLDIVSPRKISLPSNPEFAVGALTETGEVIFTYEIDPSLAKESIEREQREAKSRLERFRKGRPPRDVKNKKVLLVDDGLATGSTMLAAIKTMKREGASKIVVASPVSPPDTAKKITSLVDEVVILYIPSSFYAVGQFYSHFDQTSDEEVTLLLQKSEKPEGSQL